MNAHQRRVSRRLRRPAFKLFPYQEEAVKNMMKHFKDLTAKVPLPPVLSQYSDTPIRPIDGIIFMHPSSWQAASAVQSVSRLTRHKTRNSSYDPNDYKVVIDLECMSILDEPMLLIDASKGSHEGKPAGN